ncbi:MAG: hypothetical protein L3K13_03930 [Thermoplasmata archaeon]|nr:hypothetical protein [Thermoplasmata archaeon]
MPERVVVRACSSAGPGFLRAWIAAVRGLDAGFSRPGARPTVDDQVLGGSNAVAFATIADPPIFRKQCLVPLWPLQVTKEQLPFVQGLLKPRLSR